MWDAMMEGVTDSAGCPKMNGKPFYQASRDPFDQLCSSIEESAVEQYTNVDPATPQDLVAAKVFRSLTDAERQGLRRKLPPSRLPKLHDRAKRHVFAACSSARQYPTQGALILELGMRTWERMVKAEYDRLLVTEVAGLKRI